MKTDSLDNVLAKRQSFSHMWDLLEVKEAFRGYRKECMVTWNRLSYRQQQQMYWFLREKKRRGEKMYDNPLYALTYTHPHPFNLNGKAIIQDKLKSEKLVSAFYHGECGIYTPLEATIFDMTHVKPINF